MAMPWWFKIGTKLVLSRVPLAYRLWSRIGIFRHGRMGEDDYADNVFDFHIRQAGSALAADAVCLEIGPGDSLFTAINANRAGFARSVMVDVGDFADHDVARYAAVARSRGIDAQRIVGWKSVDEALLDLDSTYLTTGLDALRALADHSVDFAFSHAVLEHIRKAEYREFLVQLRRVLKPGAITSHQVDLQDHLEAGLNNLRFSTKVWESAFFAQAGFYTNRLSRGEHLSAFIDAGFTIVSVEEQTFAALPIARSRLAREFRDRPASELLVRVSTSLRGLRQLHRRAIGIRAH